MRRCWSRWQKNQIRIKSFHWLKHEIFGRSLIAFYYGIHIIGCCCFRRTPFCSVRPNYEVVMFQLRSGTALYLGSVTNVTSKLNPAPPLSTDFLDLSFPFAPRVLTPPPHPPPLDWVTPLFCTLFYPFSSGLGSLVHLDKLPLLPASTTRPCTCCLAALDLLPSIPLGP